MVLSSLLFLFVLILSVALCDVNTVTIKSASELISFSNSVGNGDDYSGKTVLLDADIDFAGGYSDQFIPIGYSSTRYFQGSFDGQGHTISNLALNVSSSEYVGLFGCSLNSTFQNVVIDNTCSFVSSYISKSSSSSYVGSIIGNCLSVKACMIMNSLNMASMTFSGNATDGLCIGGIVGSLSSLSDSYANIVKNCANYGTITHNGSSSGNWDGMGGIIGLKMGTSKPVYPSIQNCLNYGTLIYKGTSRSELPIGGIAGFALYSSIDNCVNFGAISSNNGNSYIGAIVGYPICAEITHCYWAENIGYNIGLLYSAVFLSGNSAFNPTTFQLSGPVSIGNSTTTSLINALNNVVDRHFLYGYSHWLLNDGGYHVSFTVDNVKLNTTLSNQIFLLSDFADRGSSVFHGWYTDSDCTSLLANYVTDSELNLYGKITENSNSYTITFDTRGGTDLNPIIGRFGSIVTLPNETTKEYCEFFWWETEYGDAVPNEFTIPVKNITLYAVWLCTHITSASELISFSKVVNSGSTCSGSTVFLDADIDFSEGYSEQFIPIGPSLLNAFLGTFDGQGHTISDLAMKASFLFTGLFGISFSTIIKNVVVDGSCSFGSFYSSNEYSSAGSVIGYCYSSEGSCIIENCVNMGSIAFKGNAIENVLIGGIVGYLDSSTHPCITRNCVNYGSIQYSGTCEYFAELGGIVGHSEGESISFIHIQNCLNYGSITNSGTSGTLAIGGIAGNSTNIIIENCVSSGVVSTSQKSEYVGAVVGVIAGYAEVVHCYWTSDVGDFSAYGYNETVNISFANSSLVSLDKETADELNEYATEQDSTWGKWLVVHLNGGSINNITQESLVEIQRHFPDPVKEESTFMFWCKDAECNEVFDPNTESVSRITDIYAAWSANNHTVTFDFDNGTVVNATFAYNSSIEYPRNIKKEGYTFGGWDNYVDLMPAKNITIKALWTETVASKSVEIVFDTKELGAKNEEEIKKELKEIIKKYTNEEFTIEGFDHNSETGETKIIIKFIDEAKAADFVRTVNENKRSDGFIKRISTVPSNSNLSPSKLLFSFFFSLLFSF